MIRKFFLILTTFIFFNFSFNSLSQAADVPQGIKLAKQQILYRGNGSEPTSLDPHHVQSNVGGSITGDLFEGLVSQNEHGDIIPAVATRWNIADSNKTFTFHLRKNAKWSNGDSVTAHDFVYSLKRAVNPVTASEYAWYLEMADIINAKEILAGRKKPYTLAVTALDDYTLQIKLANPKPYFIKMLSHYTMFPVHQKTVEKFQDKWTQPGNMVSNGAYQLTKWVVNERVEAVRNPYYWDNQSTVINKVVFLPIESNNAELNRYKAGELDLTSTIPPDFFQRLKKDSPNELKVKPHLATYYYVFNTKRKPFNDVKIRKALSMAIDRNIIVNKVLGEGQQVAFGFTPPTINGFIKPDNPYEKLSQQERLKIAKKLYQEAGFSKDKPLSFELIYNTSEGHKKIALAIASMWKKHLGVKVRINNQEWKSFLSTTRQGNFDVARAAWIADYNEASSMLDVMISNHGNNDGKYNNPEYDELMLNAKKAKDPSPFYQQAEAILAKDMPIAPIYHYVRVRLVKPHVGGYMNKNPTDQLYSKNFYILKH
ncbi:oligopeptide ABC transporter substrate-binding protein OppA [Endozoicomonas sp. SM1973]|uniref:Oligopeptide ABC transporter substrate-binding protein OppA n=1 Tax=Spartinivicinus marinus TaxID=2994442 RepID=A0A853I5Z9_9GAMM|nr:ABC transporter substrate-binding protein [Spartinivicinus marinus]MCX4027191.1 ABC transporter substrate-binding protein [Spartinivicinus marinus]NYZ66088.1 oligopeptide ABC transporter substrate-binding protein OppA [Spartinivicinus marinus]